ADDLRLNSCPTRRSSDLATTAAPIASASRYGMSHRVRVAAALRIDALTRVGALGAIERATRTSMPSAARVGRIRGDHENGPSAVDRKSTRLNSSHSQSSY